MTCPVCDGAVKLDYEYDAYYCPSCNQWLELAQCGDNDCPFCYPRPARPKE